MPARAAVPLIAHVVHGLRAGGLENGVVNLINRLPRERYRHVVICLTGYDRFAERIERDDIELHALDKRDGKDPRAYLRLWRLLRRLRPDIVHTRNFATLEAQAIAAVAGVPARIHGEHGRDMADLDGMHPRYLWMRRLLRHVIHRHVAVSSDLAAYLAETVRVPPAEIAPIVNGVDLARFRIATEERARLRAERGWGEETTVIGWVGRMEPVKNPLGLAEAYVDVAGRAAATGRRTALAMIGGGSQYERVRTALDAAGSDVRAWLPGSRDDVPGLLAAMDLFVLPSLAEGISNTILEAMAAGLPVVATDVGGNAELVVEGETGALVTPGDPSALAAAIERYVTDPARARAHGATGRQRAREHFGLDAMVSAYAGLYDGALPGHAVAPERPGTAGEEMR